MSTPGGGSLVLVGTPIGNLDDLAPRAVAALRAATVIACEDTRRTGRLLAAAGVERRELVVVNDHTEAHVRRALVDRALGGETVALVTDAGMPGISDPGEDVVAAFAEAGLAVTVIPGPSAGVAALAGSGLPTGRHVFEGFLPRKGSARSRRLDSLAAEERTVVVYEAPHRVARTLDDLVRVCGPDRRVVVARELTKLHEDWYRGDLAGAASWVREHARGEFVLVLDGAPPTEGATDDELRRDLQAARDRGLSRRDAVAEVVAAHGVAKRRVYDLSLE